jgi:hypothetical protein
MYNWEKGPMTAKQSRKINSKSSFGTTFRISKCFQRSKQKLLIIFLFYTAVLKLQNHLRMQYRKYWLNFKKIIRWHSPFKDECVCCVGLGACAEPVFINVWRTQESIPSLAGRYDKYRVHTDSPDWESIPGLLKRFTNTGSEVLPYQVMWWPRHGSFIKQGLFNRKLVPMHTSNVHVLYNQRMYVCIFGYYLSTSHAYICMLTVCPETNDWQNYRLLVLVLLTKGLKHESKSSKSLYGLKYKGKLAEPGDFSLHIFILFRWCSSWTK